MTTYSPVFDVLANGEWVRRGLVWHWKQNEPETVVVEPRDYFPSDLIACPTCLARMDEHCRRKSGKSGQHRSRLVARVCSCGSSIRPKEPMCGMCRAEMTRAVA